MKGLFVSGTDTGVGKTVASSAIFLRARKIFDSICYHKPIQTGCLLDDDAKTLIDLVKPATNICATTGFSLHRPLSPHLAAHYQKTYLELKDILAIAKTNTLGDFNIIEGAGGILVPINQRHFMVDLIKKLNLPCILVTKSVLGCINHTLLTLEILKAKKIFVAGVILMGKKDRDHENSIRFYGRINPVISLPFLPLLNALTLHSMTDIYAQQIDQLFY
jgi:dethiobiotin synthetase